MNINEAQNIVINIIHQTLDTPIKIGKETNLIGTNAVLDSMKLVEVCLALEDFADDNGFEFDWTSAATMSRTKSMFRDVGALADEFLKQSKDNQ